MSKKRFAKMRRRRGYDTPRTRTISRNLPDRKEVEGLFRAFAKRHKGKIESANRKRIIFSVDPNKYGRDFAGGILEDFLKDLEKIGFVNDFGAENSLDNYYVLDELGIDDWDLESDMGDTRGMSLGKISIGLDADVIELVEMDPYSERYGEAQHPVHVFVSMVFVRG